MPPANYESEYLEFETRVRTLIQTKCPSITETIWLEYRFSELYCLDQGFLKHPLRNDPKEIEELTEVSTKPRLTFYKYLSPLMPEKLRYLMSEHDVIPIGYIASAMGSRCYSLRVKVDPVTPLEKVRLLCL
jgi:hypothetical protein